MKQFNALRRRYEDGDDTDDDDESTLDFDQADEAEEDDEDEDMEDGDTFKLVPATGRLHVVASSSSPSAARKQSKESLEWNCWDDCDFPAHCIHARNERKRREASLNRVFL